VSIFFGGLVLSILFFFNFKGKFITLSYARIFQALVANAIPLSLIWLDFLSPTGLILGFILGQSTVILVFIYVNRIFHLPPPQGLSLNRVLPTFKRFKKLITVNSPLILIDQFAANVPLILIYTFYSDATAGQFSLANRLLLLPVVVIGNSIGQVFYKNISDNKNNPHQTETLIITTFKRLSFFSIILFTSTFLLSKPLIPIIFGRGWESAGIIATWLSFSMLIRFIVSPLSSILLVYEEYKRLALWQILNLFIQLLLVLFIFNFKPDFFKYLYLLVTVDILSYLFYFYLIYTGFKRNSFTINPV
jgi:O-antigen/teichoic acid export membrane protein